MQDITTIPSVKPTMLPELGLESTSERGETLPPVQPHAGGTKQTRLPVDPEVRANSSAAIEDAGQTIDHWDGLALSVSNMLASSQVGDVSIDQILMEIAKISKSDQQEGFLLSKTSIEFNRTMRERIYTQVKKLNEEIQELEKEIEDLQSEIESHNTFQKIGEAFASGFGGGKKKELQKMSGELKQEQAKLDETRANLKEREKYLEHSYQVMQEAVDNLKDSVERIKKSIDQVRAVWQAASGTLDNI